MALTKISRGLLDTGVSDSSDSTAITIDSSERVLIGTTTASAEVPLTVYHSGTSQFNIGGAQGGISNNVYFNGSAWANRDSSVGGGIVQIGTGGDFAFRRATSGASPTLTYSAYIDGSGNVGINTSSPSTNLHIFGTDPVLRVSDDGTTGFSSLQLLQGNATSEGTDFFYDSTTGNTHLNTLFAASIKFGTAVGGLTDTSTNVRMTIASNGSIGAPSGTNIYNASDERLKQNISTLSNSLDVINALNPVQFNWINNFEESENGKILYGFVAQEVQDVFPDAVESFGNSVEIDDTVIENPLTVRDRFFIPLLTKAIQEQQTIIDDLKTRIETLENA